MTAEGDGAFKVHPRRISSKRAIERYALVSFRTRHPRMGRQMRTAV
ncbi:hypothetical protein IQ255_15025 [Pleurocapsales cyanobacterium LEGE 10410]|nr:hypothetical protein [Pleurocapsales cyanobacterium LEGE 10410]